MQHAAPDSSGSDAGAPGEDEDVVVERDPSGRYSRFNQEVGTGRFKHVFKGFDEKQGIDVAWSKILQHSAPHFDLDDEQMTKIAAEMSIGLQLDHPNIIRCYKCWQDTQAHCINLVTEYFTSGNLRDYRQRHKHLELKAVRKCGRPRPARPPPRRAPRSRARRLRAAAPASLRPARACARRPAAAAFPAAADGRARRRAQVGAPDPGRLGVPAPEAAADHPRRPALRQDIRQRAQRRDKDRRPGPRDAAAAAL